MLMQSKKMGALVQRVLWIMPVLSFGLSACAEPVPPNCARQDRGCDITQGGYEGFTIGMSKESAFNVACARDNQGKWADQQPLFYTNGAAKSYPQTSICDLKSEALAAEEWALVEPSQLREQYVNLHFENGALSKITLQLRGWDP